MWRRSARARSISSYSNISGVTRDDRRTSIASASASVSTCSSNRPRAVAIFREDPEEMIGWTLATRWAVVKVSASVA